MRHMIDSFPVAPPAVSKGDATAVVYVPSRPIEAPRAVRRATILARFRRRPTRADLLEARLERQRFVNAGLRGRLAELTEVRDELADAIAEATDTTARELGHNHPAVTRIRAILASVPQ
jgi:hypothetical protein